jgi:hypothetical protein
MSSNTWTPPALAAEARPHSIRLWRAVEAQHVVATRTLVDNQAEQALLESLLEASKPELKPECRSLDYLLFTPFRYPTTRLGTRFRGYPEPGVWYGAETIRTSCAEIGYWRWRFVFDSAGLKRLDGIAHTIFMAAARGSGIDLRQTPFDVDAALWQNPSDYRACQALARSARSAELSLLRYASVRDGQQGACAAILDCKAFQKTGGVRRRQTWFLTVDERRASWVRTASSLRRPETHEFIFG